MKIVPNFRHSVGVSGFTTSQAILPLALIVLFTLMPVALLTSAASTNDSLTELKTNVLSQSVTSNDSALAASVVQYELERYLAGTGDKTELQKRIDVLDTQIAMGRINTTGPAAEYFGVAVSLWDQTSPALQSVLNEDADVDTTELALTNLAEIRVSAKASADKWVTETLNGNFRDTRARLERQQLIFWIFTPLAAVGAFAAIILGIRAAGQARLTLANERLVRENAIKTQFVSQVSHELNTPLTSVIAFTDLLNRKAGEELNERQAKFVTVIKRNADYLKLLISDLVDVSRAESGTLEIEPHKVDIKQMLEGLQTSFGPIVQGKSQELEMITTGDIPMIMADSVRVLQVVSNVIANASKFSEPGTRIVVTGRAESGGIAISVSDEGPGMTDEDAEHAFEMFYRGSTEGVRRVSGTGIGLAISNSIVLAHGGTIDISPAQPKGTVVRVWLPISNDLDGEVSPA